MKKLLSALLSLTMLICMLPALPAAAEANDAPTVIPAVREWEGSSGKFLLKDGMKVVLESDSQLTDGEKGVIAEYFANIAGLTVTVGEGTPKTGDIYLCYAEDTQLGSEGYTAEATESGVTISASTGRGLLYGITTVLQSYTADGHMPCGTVRDWPYYEIRSGMIDVARAYIPLEYIEEITKYFAYFKLNEIHLHINDNGSDAIGYFRLESDVPGLTSEEHYTKDEYRAYQKRMLDYGVEVVTEIDTPGHSKCFGKAVPEYMIDEWHLDVTNPEAIQFVLNLWDEYLTGDDPIFVTKTVHFGTDEFLSGYNEEMRAYTNTLIEHISSRGYTPRFWGAFGNEGFNGTTEVSGDAQTNFWAVSLSDYKTLFSMGYDIINTCGPRLYCVPAGNYGFIDYFDLKLLYGGWYVNYMGYNSDTAVDPDSEQLKGASFALWNDLWCDWGGFSTFDIFDRLRYQVCLISEKTWDGEQTRDMDADDFVERFDTLSLVAGGSDPGRHVSLPLTGSDIGKVQSVGFPYLFSADITVSDYADATILSGGDGTLYLGTRGKLSYARESYIFTYDYIPVFNETANIKLYADNKHTILIVDDTWFYEPTSNKSSYRSDSSTFILPFESAGSKNCKVENISVNKPDFLIADMLYEHNIALGKDVTVSGLEIDYGLNEPLAVDGDPNTRLSFARNKDEQWMIVDLGFKTRIDSVVISFFERVSEYEIWVSSDGEDYTRVYEVSGLGEGIKESDTIQLDGTEARYIKYIQLKRWYCEAYSTYYSGGICEFEVYGSNQDYTALIEEADSFADADVITALRNLKRYMKGNTIYAPHLAGLASILRAALDAPADVSDDTSAEASNVSAPAESGGKAWLIAAAAAAMIALSGAAFAIIKKKKK
ncbi:MAG TPA: glycoside hydrolase family 20 zincin-like fold domain-containing protein [Bacillota bacterium]|nr:glycoside hydrolase family 20 zincin-like fold domain-containing protein [Bacillota bacterium]